MKPLLEMRRIFGKQFLKFILVGAFCNLLAIASLYCFTEILGLYYLLSVLIILIYGNFIGFCLNKLYTFRTLGKYFWRELWKYYSVMLSGFALNLGSIYILVDILKIWYIYAAVIVSVGLLFLNFLLHKYWSFKISRISRIRAKQPDHSSRKK